MEQQRNFSYCLTEYRFETRHLQKSFNPLSTSNSMSPPQRSIYLGRDIGSNKQALFRGIFRRSVCPVCMYLNNLKTCLPRKQSNKNLLDYHGISFIPISSTTWWQKYPYDLQQISAVGLWVIAPVAKQKAPSTVPVSVFFLCTVFVYFFAYFLRCSRVVKKEKQGSSTVSFNQLILVEWLSVKG